MNANSMAGKIVDVVAIFLYESGSSVKHHRPRNVVVICVATATPPVGCSLNVSTGS
jgi:hypothetical protein